MVEENRTAIININPGSDQAVVALHQEALKLQQFAESVTIATSEDVKLVTDDLSLLAKLKKAIEEKRKEYVGPINDHLKQVNDAFKMIVSPLESADKINRNKVMEYWKKQELLRQEAEAINRQKEELARREAAFNGTGEVTIDTTPVIIPPAPPTHVRTDVGTLGTMKVRKWEVEDITKVPAEYLQVDSVAVGKLVRAGIKSISGIRIWEEETLKVNAK